ncbi:hypothetical protein D9Q98_000765 [Chlorella vulgaris]|uniref:Uncharacterized protein n=1 Tax=Chlorella vulgaris TaxID=3077 RepID=A0A9D4TZW9_CHLVU|nr:hypothetical protein D9Q98_000765 [Chlorella vulgaris]
MASGAVASRGGLAEALSRRTPWSTEPKPIRPRHVRLDAPEAEPARVSSLNSTSNTSASTTASGDGDPAGLEAGLDELRRLFATECSLGTSAPGFGVSPPVRSGAANGLVHDSLWRQEAPRTCKASLRVLHERAGPGVRCLTSCAGDYRLLMASPEQNLQLLSGAVETDDADARLAPLASSARSLSSNCASPAGPLAWHPSNEPSDLFGF